MMIENFSIESKPIAIAIAGILLSLPWLIRLFVKRVQKSPFPRIIGKKGSLMREVLVEARNKYPDEPFDLQVSPAQEVVLLPHALYNEVKDMPEDLVSFPKYIRGSFMSKYTDCDLPHEVIDTIKIDITRNIGTLLKDLQDEAAFIFNYQIGKIPTWKAFPAYTSVLGIVAELNSRAFVGLPLCRDPEWIKANITFTIDTLKAAKAIKAWHPFLRPIVKPFLAEFKHLQTYRTLGRDKIKPQLTSLLQNLNDPASKEPSTAESLPEADLNLVRWALNHFKKTDWVDAAEAGRWQMVISFVSIHTTSIALTQILFDLAAYPQYVKELREEIEAVIKEENHPDRILQKTSMAKLKKMDSFMKESQRLSPPSLVGVNREVVAPAGVKLSTGHTIPYGSHICFSHPYHPKSEVPANPAVTMDSQPPLDVFAPFRYYDIRNIPGEESKHHYVSTNSDNIVFGAGPTACPGRFFAANEIKVTLVEILKRYDLALGPKGETEEQGGFKRPPLHLDGLGGHPDPQALIYLRDRQ